MGKLVLAIIFILFFNSTYAQIIGISTLQKVEVAKGLIAYDECRLTLDSVYQEKESVLFALGVEKGISKTYIDENKGLAILNGSLTKENKTLKSSGLFWKIFGVSGTIVGFYLGTKI